MKPVFIILFAALTCSGCAVRCLDSGYCGCKGFMCLQDICTGDVDCNKTR